MKKHLLVVFFLFLAFGTFGQMTLIQYSNNSLWMQVVNLQLSGKKYAIFDYNSSQVRLYNLDHSIWKTIIIPATIGPYALSSNAPQYISENLFNIDNKVDMCVAYNSSATGPTLWKCMIIDETGSVIKTIDSSLCVTVYNVGVFADSFVGIFTYETYNGGGGYNISKVYPMIYKAHQDKNSPTES